MVLLGSGNDAPVEFETTEFAGSYTLSDFGFVIDRLTLDVSNSEKEYVNFKDVTEIFDTDTFDYGAKLEMDLTGKTSVNIAGNWSDIDYPNPKAGYRFIIRGRIYRHGWDHLGGDRQDHRQH